MCVLNADSDDNTESIHWRINLKKKKITKKKKRKLYLDLHKYKISPRTQDIFWEVVLSLVFINTNFSVATLCHTCDCIIRERGRINLRAEQSDALPPSLCLSAPRETVWQRESDWLMEKQTQLSQLTKVWRASRLTCQLFFQLKKHKMCRIYIMTASVSNFCYISCSHFGSLSLYLKGSGEVPLDTASHKGRFC